MVKEPHTLLNWPPTGTTEVLAHVCGFASCFAVPFALISYWATERSLERYQHRRHHGQ